MENDQDFPGQEYIGHPLPPPWYSFEPSDQTLIESFLVPRIHQQNLPPHEIREVDVFAQTPWAVAKANGYCEQKTEMYFFTDKNLQSAFCKNWKKAPKRAVQILRNHQLIGRKQMMIYKDPTQPNPEVKWYLDEFMAQGIDSSIRLYKLYTGKQPDLVLISEAAAAAGAPAAGGAPAGVAANIVYENLVVPAEGGDLIENNPVVSLPPTTQDFSAPGLNVGSTVATSPYSSGFQHYPSYQTYQTSALWGQFLQYMWHQFQIYGNPNQPPLCLTDLKIPVASTGAQNLHLPGAQNLHLPGQNLHLPGAQNLHLPGQSAPRPAIAQNRYLDMPSTSGQAPRPAIAQNRYLDMPSTSGQANQGLNQQPLVSTSYGPTGSSNLAETDLEIDFDEEVDYQSLMLSLTENQTGHSQDPNQSTTTPAGESQHD